MKNGKRPTYEQRKVLAYYGLDAHDWLVSKDTPTEMVLVHRHLDNQIKRIPKNNT